VIYCINPNCQQRQNPNYRERCQACGNSLLVNERYQLVRPLRELRQEDYAEVFEVDDRGTPKVMKILKQDGPRWIEMLQREATVLSKLRHPGIPRVEPDGYFTLTLVLANGSKILHCLVMEKIEGQNLEQWLQDNKPISQKQALNWLQQLVEVLDRVHASRFFHRDIKPSNIMLKSDGQLVLIDFGAVKYATTTYFINLNHGQQGTSILSFGYTPPEQIQGQAVYQSDFFALGRTFVHLLTGQPPGSFSKETGKLIWRDFVATPVSKPLVDLIDALMAPSSKKRPQNTQVILQRLEQIIIETDEFRQSLESSFRSSLDDLPLPLPFKFVAQRIFQHQFQKWVKQYRVPTIALYGRSGSGKSSLINAIMGERIAEVGVAIPTTKNLEPYELQRNGWTLRFIDSRGVGDSGDDAASQIALNNIVKQKIDILLFVIPANERGYVRNDVSFLTALQQKHQRVHGAKLPIILVINKIDQIDPPFEWNPIPPYDLSLDSQIRKRSPTTAREAKESNIVKCVQARFNEYKDLITTYVPVCAFWDDFGNRLYNIEGLAIQIYNCIPDEAAKQGFGGATAEIFLKKAVAETYTVVAAWFAYFCFFLPSAVYERFVFTTQFRLVNIIAQIARINEDQSNATEDFLRQLGVQQRHARADAKADLAMTLAIGKAAIHYFIEKGTIREAKQALAQEKERREPEFQEALQGGPDKVVSKLREIDKELHKLYGLQRLYEDEQDDESRVVE
jgi:serine/threonine protein kinase